MIDTTAEQTKTSWTGEQKRQTIQLVWSVGRRDVICSSFTDIRTETFDYPRDLRKWEEGK